MSAALFCLVQEAILDLDQNTHESQSSETRQRCLRSERGGVS
jgi:hypothetical protein